MSLNHPRVLMSKLDELNEQIAFWNQKSSVTADASATAQKATNEQCTRGMNRALIAHQRAESDSEFVEDMLQRVKSLMEKCRIAVRDAKELFQEMKQSRSLAKTNLKKWQKELRFARNNRRKAEQRVAYCEKELARAESEVYAAKSALSSAESALAACERDRERNCSGCRRRVADCGNRLNQAYDWLARAREELAEARRELAYWQDQEHACTLAVDDANAAVTEAEQGVSVVKYAVEHAHASLEETISARHFVDDAKVLAAQALDLTERAKDAMREAGDKCEQARYVHHEGNSRCQSAVSFAARGTLELDYRIEQLLFFDQRTLF